MKGLVVTTLTKQERDWLIQEVYRLGDELHRLAVNDAPDDELDVPMDSKRERADEYFERLPIVPLSACPFTGELLVKAFDPWGLDGFWWQGAKVRSCVEPDSPDAFHLLQGAVHLNQLPPMGGQSGASVGPEVPFVIPRILNMPGMVAVVSSVVLECGYTAFPIAYYSETAPEAGTLCQSWRETTYGYTRDGQPCWSMPADPWDFELKPWIEQGKVKWIEPGDDTWSVKGGAWEAYPWKDLAGRQEQQVICGSKLKTSPPPNNEEYEPFE